MDFFLRMPGQTPVFMGSQSFGFFYPEHGFDMLTNLVETKPELIEFIKIVTEQGKYYTVEDFLMLFEGKFAIKIRRWT